MANSYENSEENMKKVRILTMIMYAVVKPSGVVRVLGWMGWGVLKKGERERAAN
jgi:hypothetical protein